MIRLEITGRPASNKNSRRIITKGRGGRPLDHPISLPSAAYERFSKDAVKQIRQQVELSGYIDPVFVKYTFYQKGKLRQDSANAKQSIDDVLEASGIIANDDLILSFAGEIVRHSLDWKTVVEIELDGRK